MNVPNLITIARFFFIPMFIVLFFSESPYANMLSFLVLLCAGFSDMLDGYIARKKGQITELGKLLDPLADKLMMITVIISFLIDGRISWVAASIFFIRDAGMITASAFFHFQEKRKVPAANLFGKITTVMYYLAFLMIMFQLQYDTEFLWAAIFFSILASGIYIFTIFRVNQISHKKERT